MLQQQVEAVLDTSLRPALGIPVRLRDLAPERKQVELEFFLPMGRVTAPALTALCQQHDPLSRGASRSVLPPCRGCSRALSTWCSSGRGAGICSTKSNHLGMSPADYGRPALERAMREHRYDLQYQLYSLALHRLLALRLPGYDFDRHFGGVFYLFLRGMPQGHFPCQAQPGTGAGLDELFSKGVTSDDHRLEKSNKAEAWGEMKGETMIERLKALALAGIRQLDLQFARLVADLGGSPELVLGPRSPAMSWGAAMSACRWRCSLRAVTGRGSSRPFGLDPIRAGICWRISRILQAGPPSLRPAPGGERTGGETPAGPLRLWGSPLPHPPPRL